VNIRTAAVADVSVALLAAFPATAVAQGGKRQQQQKMMQQMQRKMEQLQNRWREMLQNVDEGIQIMERMRERLSQSPRNP